MQEHLVRPSMLLYSRQGQCYVDSMYLQQQRLQLKKNRKKFGDLSRIELLFTLLEVNVQ